MTTAIEYLKKDLKFLDQIIKPYKEDLENASTILDLTGKELSIACAQHVSWSVYYHQKSVEIKNVKDYMEMRLEEKHGELWRKYTEKSDWELNDKAKTQYINSNNDYLDVKEQYLKIKELYEQYEAINDGFKSRGYILNNLTKIVCTEHADWEIH